MTRAMLATIAAGCLLAAPAAMAGPPTTEPPPVPPPAEPPPVEPPPPTEPPPGPTPPDKRCKGRAFPWYDQCWSAGEGRAFVRALNRHGVTGQQFKHRHPQLAAVFVRPWPPPKDWGRKIARRLNATLCDFGPQCGTGASYVISGKRWNINPFYVAAISGIESTFGQANCAYANAWGIIAYCGSGFSSWAHGIEYTTRLIRTLFVNRGLTDAWSIGASYCPPCGSGHGEKATYYMRVFFGSGPGVFWKTAVEAVR